MTNPQPETTQLSEPYEHHQLFHTLESQERFPQKLLWIAISVAFVIANVPAARISAAVLRILQLLPEGLATGLLPLSSDLRLASEQITRHAFVPLKELLFLLSLLIITYPIAQCISKSREYWHQLKLKRMAVTALALFCAMGIFVFPYSYPRGVNSHASGLGGNGQLFAEMSVTPFQENDPMFYKRLLKPAIAHFLHLDGYLRYYLFSLFCTYIFILLLVVFWETRLAPAGIDADNIRSPHSPLKWLIYLSVMTSSFVLTDFQWPGYSDHISYILVLLAASMPMTAQARLATLALCVLNHDGIALALAPIVLFCFPKKERAKAFIAVTLFYAIVTASYGFSIEQGLQAQQTVSDSGTGAVWQSALRDPAFFLASLFFTYKLLWIVPALAVAMLWNRKHKATLIALVVITFFPVLLTLVAWDTTRVAGFGWLGVLLALGFLAREYAQRPRSFQFALLLLLSVNLVIPSYNVVLGYTDSFAGYPYRGLYALTDSTLRLILR